MVASVAGARCLCYYCTSATTAALMIRGMPTPAPPAAPYESQCVAMFSCVAADVVHGAVVVTCADVVTALESLQHISIYHCYHATMILLELKISFRKLKR